MKKKLSHLRVAIVLDTRRKLANGEFPLRLRITIGKVQYYFRTNLQSTKELYDRANEPKPQKEARKLLEQMEGIVTSAKTVCDNMPVFTPEQFKKQFFKEASTPFTDSQSDIFTAFQTYINELHIEGRISTAKSYGNAMFSIAAFSEGKLLKHRESQTGGVKKDAPKFKKLRFEDVTVEWLKQYSSALESLGTSNATIGIYCRSLRAIYHYAMKENSTLHTSYPFGKGKFEIPTASKNKRALSPEAIKSILSYQPQTEPEQRAKDLWVFSYLCSGINIADVIRLKFNQLKFDAEGCTIEFLRAKTRRKADKTRIVIELDTDTTAIVADIIKRQGNATKEGYIFPYLNNAVTPQAQYAEKNSLLKLLNKSLSKIAENLKLQMELTTYVARHSYATALLRSGVSVAEISESLGHANLKTTENYLGGFSKESKRRNSAKLLHS